MDIIFIIIAAIAGLIIGFLISKTIDNKSATGTLKTAEKKAN